MEAVLRQPQPAETAIRQEERLAYRPSRRFVFRLVLLALGIGLIVVPVHVRLITACLVRCQPGLASFKQITSHHYTGLISPLKAERRMGMDERAEVEALTEEYELEHAPAAR